MKEISNFFENLPSTEQKSANEFKKDMQEFFKSLTNEAPIDEKTASIVNYIFYRLKGMITSMRYSIDSETTFNSIRREYTFEIRKSGVTNIEDINRGLERIRSEGIEWLPVPGKFVDFCRKEIKWQSDTRDHEMMNKFALESDEHKEKRRAKGRSALNDILRSLKK